MKKFTQTLVIGMMTFLLGTVLFGACPVRADGEATVEVIKNPNGNPKTGRYQGAYQKLQVGSVSLSDAGDFLLITIGSRVGSDFMTTVMGFPKQVSSTAPCPIVAAANWQASKSSRSMAELHHTPTNEEGDPGTVQMYSSGKGKTDPKEDRSGEITGLRIKGNSATGSFQFLCWDENRKNFYHVVGKFNATLDK